MDRKSLKSHFRFNKQEQSGIFYLLLFIVIFQVLYFVIRSYAVLEKEDSLEVDGEYQAKIDQLKEEGRKRDSLVTYPFNPNFISDYKGYTLGMSTAEIDRLHAFRAKNQFVDSEAEFQRITLISDSLLRVMAPYFKFPEWKRSGKSIVAGRSLPSANLDVSQARGVKRAPLNDELKKDLNRVTAEELRSINGIGEKLSQRIVKFRDRLGGFVIEEQLAHVYGLDPQVVARALDRFAILESPSISKININTASIEEITKLVYIKYEVAAKIVVYREEKGVITSFDELTKIEDFPSEKLDIIELYLQL